MVKQLFPPIIHLRQRIINWILQIFVFYRFCIAILQSPVIPPAFILIHRKHIFIGSEK